YILRPLEARAGRRAPNCVEPRDHRDDRLRFQRGRHRALHQLHAHLLRHGCRRRSPTVLGTCDSDRWLPPAATMRTTITVAIVTTMFVLACGRPTRRVPRETETRSAEV